MGRAWPLAVTRSSTSSTRARTGSGVVWFPGQDRLVTRNDRVLPDSHVLAADVFREAAAAQRGDRALGHADRPAAWSPAAGRPCRPSARSSASPRAGRDSSPRPPPGTHGRPRRDHAAAAAPPARRRDAHGAEPGRTIRGLWRRGRRRAPTRSSHRRPPGDDGPARRWDLDLRFTPDSRTLLTAGPDGRSSHGTSRMVDASRRSRAMPAPCRGWRSPRTAEPRTARARTARDRLGPRRRPAARPALQRATPTRARLP